MPEKNTRQELIEKFLTGYKITREDWIKLLMAYALVEEAAKNTTPATVEEVLGGSDNEKFITSFLLDYFWKTKILGTNPDSNLNDFSAVATKLKGLIADSSTNTTNTWSSQKIMETITASEAGMLTYKGQVADIAALNAIASPKVGDTYNVLGDGNGANFTWDGTAWDELGMHIVVDNAPIQNSKNPVSSGGVFVELAKMLKKDGSIAMDNGYNPNKPQDVATKNFVDYKFKTRLTPYTDLNNYTNAGLYYIDYDSDWLTISNRPHGSSGFLEVIGETNWILQRYTVYYDTTLVYTRRLYNGSWSGWKLTNGNMQPKAFGSVRSDGSIIGYSTYDGSALTCSKTNTGTYRIYSNLIVENTIVLANTIPGIDANISAGVNGNGQILIYAIRNTGTFIDTYFNFMFI